MPVVELHDSLLILPCASAAPIIRKHRAWAIAYPRYTETNMKGKCNTDAAIIGGAGQVFHAALTMAEHGNAIVLVERQASLGGQLRSGKVRTLCGRMHREVAGCLPMSELQDIPASDV